MKTSNLAKDLDKFNAFLSDIYTETGIRRHHGIAIFEALINRLETIKTGDGDLELLSATDIIDNWLEKPIVDHYSLPEQHVIAEKFADIINRLSDAIISYKG